MARWIVADRPCRAGVHIADDESGLAAPNAAHDERECKMRIKSWLKTVPTLAIIGSVLFLVLSVGSGLLLWGSGFAHNMVHNQLSEQQIKFPAKGSPALDPKEFPGLQRYAGQPVDNGPKAKAYADQFIKVHLKAIANGQTYSQVSAASLADPKNTTLAGETQTLFRGETLRGLLLYAWGWSVVGEIAYLVGLAALLGALAVLFALALGFFAHERNVKVRATPAGNAEATHDARQPVGVS